METAALRRTRCLERPVRPYVCLTTPEGLSAVLAFVVTIKPRTQSVDWLAYSALANRTLTSLTRQTCGDYRIFAVHDDLPAEAPRHSRLTYLPLNLPVPHDRASQNHDKALRIMAGVDAAQRQGATHIMAVDSDDFVSVRLAEFVRGQPGAPGWVSLRGYIWPAGSRVVLHENRDLSDLCGSTQIIRADLVHHFISNRRRAYVERLEMPEDAIWFDHQKHEMGRDGRLVELPFRGVVYCVLNGENIRASSTLVSSRVRSDPIRFARRLARRSPRLLTNRMRQEFGLVF
jgi:hypothetical protein